MTRLEILGRKLTREELTDENGNLRLHWVLRDENGQVCWYMKNWNDFLKEMMFVYCEYMRVI